MQRLSVSPNINLEIKRKKESGIIFFMMSANKKMNIIVK